MLDFFAQRLGNANIGMVYIRKLESQRENFSNLTGCYNEVLTEDSQITRSFLNRSNQRTPSQTNTLVFAIFLASLLFFLTILAIGYYYQTLHELQTVALIW